MNALLTIATIAAVLIVFTLPAWGGYLRDRRIDKQLRSAARAEGGDGAGRAAARPAPARRTARPLVQTSGHGHRRTPSPCG